MVDEGGSKQESEDDSKVTFRPALVDDVPQLASLRWDFMLESYDREIPIDRDHFFSETIPVFQSIIGTWGVFVAVSDRRIVSHIFINPVRKVPSPWLTVDEWGYVTNCYTVPDLRGKGIGGSVMRCAIDWARGRNLELLLVWPSDESVSFYRRLGFENLQEPLQMKLR